MPELTRDNTSAQPVARCACGYALLDGQQCPECGRSFELAGPLDAQASGLAIAAVALGILGLILPLLGIAALITGITAINRIDDPTHRVGGRGMARAGAILGGIGTIITFAVVVLPLSLHNHHHPPYMTNHTQLRGIHQAMNIYAQSNKIGQSRGHYPGLNPDGSVNNVTVAHRYKRMLDRNIFPGDYLINPMEDHAKKEWKGGPVTTRHYSYSLLDVSDPGGRRHEWSETLSSEAVIITDRNTGRDAQQHVSSVWTNKDSGQWEGSVVYNDNRALFETKHVLPTRYHVFPHAQDNLFHAAGPDDAKMIDRGR